MNNDAQEAAMGLLSLSPNNVPLPPPLVPQKRKHPHRDQQHQQHQQGGLKKRSSSKLVHQQRQEKEKDQELQVEVEHGQEHVQVEGDIPSESISCICGSTYDDGFSIACDDCLRWCHGACFGIASAAEAPDEWRCWVCDPREVDREGAAKLQRAKREELLRIERERTQQQQQQLPQPSHHPHRRRTSPGVDRKQRRTSATAVDNINNGSNGHKRKRRGSMVVPPAVVEDDVDVVVDIDEPWSHSYVHITEDVVPTVSTREKLQRHAQNWRGITAIEPFPPPSVAVQPLPDPACVRPPAYAVHTTAPIPSEAIITPFTSTITPSSEYLADPLNAYAHLGMPKPFVHLVGPPLDLALDARIAGDSARFVRSGCRPNAVLRPVLCRQGSRGMSRQNMETMETDSAAKASSSSTEDSEPGTLAFAVFALRDLKAHEEVVLGWEWDDGNAVHELPALIKTPHLFPPAKHAHLRAQMSNILHLLSSTFTTCACGAHARDCALAQMERFVDGNLDWDRARGWARGRDDEAEGEAVDLGPLLGRMRGFRTRERVRGSGGLTGVEMDVGEERSFDVDGGRDGDVVMGEGDEEETEDELELDAWRQDDYRATRPGKPKTKPISSRRNVHPHIQQRHTRTQLRPPDPDPGPDVALQEETEEKMPPKMRKRWIQREKEVLRETFGGREGSNPAGSGSGDVEMRDVSTSSGEGAFVDRKFGEQVEPPVERTVHTVASPPDAEHASESDSSPHPTSSSTPSTLTSLPTTASLTSIRTHLLSLPPPTASPSASFARLSLASPSVSSDSFMFGVGLRRPIATVVGSPQVLQGTESLARKVGSGIGLGIGHGRKSAHLSTSSVVVENNPMASVSSTSVRARLESTPPMDSETTMVGDISSESRTFSKSPSQEGEASPPPPTAEAAPQQMSSEAFRPTHVSPSPPRRDEPLDHHSSASPSRRAPSPPPTLMDDSTTDLASTSALPPPPASPPHPQTLSTDHPDFRWASPEPRAPWVPDDASTAVTYGMSLSAPTLLRPPSQLPDGMTLPASTPIPPPPPPPPPLSPSSLPTDHPFRWRSHSPGRATTFWGTPPRLATPPPPREPTPPPPPPPPKVKMSLKDFAMRKKKQREEEERASASIEPRSVGGGSAEASPMVVTIGLPAEGSDGRVGIGDEGVKGKVDEAGSTKMGGGESRLGAGESLEVEMGDVQARRLCESVSGTEKVSRDLEHERVNDILVAERSHPPSSEDVLADPVALVHSTRIKDEDVEMASVIHSAIAVNSLSSTAAAEPFTASTLPISLPVNPTYYVATLQAKTELIEQPLLSATTTEREYRPSPGPSKSNGGPPHARPPLKPPARRASSPSPSIVTQSSHPPSQEDGEITSTASSPLPPRNISPVNTRKLYIPHSHTPPTQPRSFQMAPSSSSPPPPSRRPSIPLYRSPAPPSTTPTPALRLPPSGPRALRMGNNTFPAQRPGYPSRSLPLGPSAVTNDWDSRRIPLGPSANRESTEPSRGRSTPTTPRPQQPLPAAVPHGPSADRDKLDLEHERSWSPRPRARAGGGAGWGR